MCGSSVCGASSVCGQLSAWQFSRPLRALDRVATGACWPHTPEHPVRIRRGAVDSPEHRCYPRPRGDDDAEWSESWEQDRWVTRRQAEPAQSRPVALQESRAWARSPATWPQKNKPGPQKKQAGASKKQAGASKKNKPGPQKKKTSCSSRSSLRSLARPSAALIF